MKKKLIPLMLLAGGCLLAETHFSIGVGIGTPGYYTPPVAVATVRPSCPGPGYTWVDGYRTVNGGWVAGYWAPPYGWYSNAPERYGRRWDRDDFRDHDRDRERGRSDERGRGYADRFRR